MPCSSARPCCPYGYFPVYGGDADEHQKFYEAHTVVSPHTGMMKKLNMKIDKIHVENFKSLYDTEFEPGNVNVLIGTNGSGKSTVLESIGILSAAMTDRVNDNSLQRKGARLSPPAMNLSHFQTITHAKPYAEFGVDWTEDGVKCAYHADMVPPTSGDTWKYLSEAAAEDGQKVMERSNRTKAPIGDDIGYFMLSSDLKDKICRKMGEHLVDYGIYQPETRTLRGNASDPVPAAPVGLSGGHLAEAVQDILTEKDGEIKFGDLDEEDILSLIDWADGFRIAVPKKTTLNANISSTRQVVEFEDRYLKKNACFTGYDASEGALYVLFILTLAMHPNAPSVFSIENFDRALNPRLAQRLMQIFCGEILKREKTVFLTTHNPLVLDGLDLSDDRIRLFTVKRNDRGYTTLERIRISNKLLETGMPLSRLWMDGYIGGTPDLL